MTFDTRLTPELVDRHTRTGHWGTQTFYQVLAERAAAHPDREALRDRSHRVTYGTLRARVDRVSSASARATS
jgi:2,3-dihydroxybenzoate-AMP ligase